MLYLRKICKHVQQHNRRRLPKSSKSIIENLVTKPIKHKAKSFWPNKAKNEEIRSQG